LAVKKTYSQFWDEDRRIAKIPRRGTEVFSGKEKKDRVQSLDGEKILQTFYTQKQYVNTDIGIWYKLLEKHYFY
jgi:hypothetical protein